MILICQSLYSCIVGFDHVCYESAGYAYVQVVNRKGFLRKTRREVFDNRFQNRNENSLPVECLKVLSCGSLLRICLAAVRGTDSSTPNSFAVALTSANNWLNSASQFCLLDFSWRRVSCKSSTAVFTSRVFFLEKPTQGLCEGKNITH